MKNNTIKYMAFLIIISTAMSSVHALSWSDFQQQASQAVTQAKNYAANLNWSDPIGTITEQVNKAQTSGKAARTQACNNIAMGSPVFGQEAVANRIPQSLKDKACRVCKGEWEGKHPVTLRVMCGAQPSPEANA